VNGVPLHDPLDRGWEGVTFTNPVTDESIDILEVGADEEGERLLGRLRVEPHGSGPPLHVHPSLDEWYEVEAGELTVHLDGNTRVLTSGQTAVVPKGSVHGFENRSDEPVTFVGGSRPGRRLIHILATLCGLAHDDELDDQGRPSFLQAMVFARAFQEDMYLASPPLVVQRALWTIGAPIGRMLGYRPTYDRYLRPEFWADRSA
jgi:mannose-6-phosphate isomerase-like protein (cupin superfamily)